MVNADRELKTQPSVDGPAEVTGIVCLGGPLNGKRRPDTGQNFLHTDNFTAHRYRWTKLAAPIAAGGDERVVCDLYVHDAGGEA